MFFWIFGTQFIVKVRAKTGTFSIETLDVHLAPWWEAWFGSIRSSRHTSFIAYERGWVIFEYSHVFRSGGVNFFDSTMNCVTKIQKKICFFVVCEVIIIENLKSANCCPQTPQFSPCHCSLWIWYCSQWLKRFFGVGARILRRSKMAE
jgi:hypothetical protein